MWKASGRFQQCSLSPASDRSIASNNVWRSAVMVRRFQSFVRVIGWTREECQHHVQCDRESEIVATNSRTSLIRIMISALPCHYLSNFRILIRSFCILSAHSQRLAMLVCEQVCSACFVVADMLCRVLALAYNNQMVTEPCWRHLDVQLRH